MTSIDERVVSMAFENAKFEAGVAKTMATLAKLTESLRLIGAVNGLQGLEAAANKITLANAGLAADKLKGKMDFSGAVKGLSDIQGASDRLSLGGVGASADGVKGKFALMSAAVLGSLSAIKDKLVFPGAAAAFGAISTAASKVVFTPLTNALENLKGRFNFGREAAKGFSEVETAASRVNFRPLSRAATDTFSEVEKGSFKVHLQGITSAIQESAKGFSILQGAAAVALGNIATKATAAGTQFAKSFTVAPIKQGFDEYSTNLSSIQTVLANTQDKGSTLKDVNAALAELNKYSDQTIYNFGEMAKNIGTFTAAGVDLKTATQSIKGIANLAALSGSNSQQASTAMYQLSQAIASGKVGLQDWNSVVNAGMGGAVFQKNLVKTAIAMGTLNESAVKIDKTTGKLTINGKSFRESITARPGEKSFLTSEVLTGSLKTFTGDLSDAQLAAQGFSKESIKGIQAQAKSAQDAATKVKTIAQVVDIAKETLGSGYSKTFQLLFGDFGQAKKTFTELSQAVNGVINKSADARNAVLADFAKLGGRDKLIEGIKNAFKALGAVLAPVKEAFREIFPAKTGKDLYDLSVRFADFTKSLKIGPETAENLKRTFAGFFAVLSIGKSILGGVFTALGEVLGAFGHGTGGLLNFTGNIGDLAVALDHAIKKSEGFRAFFVGIGRILALPVNLLLDLSHAISNLFKGVDGKKVDGASASFNHLKDSLSPLGKVLSAINAGWDHLVGIMSAVSERIGPALGDVGGQIKNFTSAIVEAFKNADYDRVFDVIQTTLIGGIFLTIKKALGGGVGFNFNLLGGGVVDKMKDSLDVLNGSLKAIQTNLKADTLLKIATALAVLAAGIFALSQIDSKRLATSMTAVSVGLAQLIGAMALLSPKGGGGKGATKGAFLAAVQMPIIAGALVMLAFAVDTLAIAVFAFSKLSWEELVKGLAGVGGALVAVGLGVTYIPVGIGYTALSLIPLAGALLILAAAMKTFGTMDWQDIAKGLVSVAFGLDIMLKGTLGINGKALLLVGPALAGIAISLLLLAGAVRSFGSMDVETIGKGIGGIAAALIILGYAILSFPPYLGAQAIALIAVSVALSGIAVAIGLMGGLKVTTIIKGLIGMGEALGILAAGLVLMQGTGYGALALIGAATGIAILTPALAILGSLKILSIVKGLGAIAALLVTLGVGGFIAGPGLLVAGAGLTGLGVGLLAAGLGVNLLAKGLALLSDTGSKGLAVMVTALTAFVALLPRLLIDFVKGLVGTVGAVAEVAPKVVEAFAKIINSVLDLIVKIQPKVLEAILSILASIVTIINEKAVPIAEAGFALLLAFLHAIDSHIEEVAAVGGRIISKFLAALQGSLPALVKAGSDVLVKFLDGLRTELPRVVTSGTNLITTYLTTLASNFPRISAAGARLLVAFLKGISDHIPDVIKAGGTIIIKILEGIGAQAGRITKTAARVTGDFIQAAADAMLTLVNKIARVVVNFLNGIATAIRTHNDDIRRAGFNVADAMLDGLVDGLLDLGGRVKNAVGDLVGGMPKIARKLLGIRSPSRVFREIGGYTMLGLSQGLDAGSAGVMRSVEGTGSGVVSAMTRTLQAVPDILDGLMDVDPVITPVLDLTKIEAGAKQMGDMTNVVPITAAASYGQAAAISSAQEAAAQAALAAPEAAASAPTVLQFEQNITSPEAISAADVYRQTNNQLSQAKRVLGVS